MRACSLASRAKSIAGIRTRSRTSRQEREDIGDYTRSVRAARCFTAHGRDKSLKQGRSTLVARYLLFATEWVR
jgi:hypothetical protein